jgi:hypothetical protein
MNLGAQLNQAQAFHEEAARRAELAQRAAAEEEALKRTLSSRHFFDYAFQVFEVRLRNGNLPGVIALGGKTFNTAANSLDTYKWAIPANDAAAWRSKGKGVWSPEHPVHATWLEFEARCLAAGLAPVWTYEYGMGHESWYNLTVVAAS